MAKILPAAGLILERTALATGFLAAAIAVGGFLARSLDLLGPNSEADLQRSAAIGGICGFAFGFIVILLDAFLS